MGMTMRIDLDATVVDSDGDAIARLHEIIFSLDSGRVAGFLVVVDGVAPREVHIMVGQVAEVEEERISLTLSGDEVAALPDAYQHLYIAPNQDLESEIDAAEGAAAAPVIPDPA